MKKYIISFLTVFVLVSAGYTAEIRPAAAKEETKEELKLAANFKLKDLYNNEYALSSYRNKQPVVLFFFTTWCPFCRKELSKLNDRYLGLARYGFELFVIDVGEPIEKVDKFAKSYSLAFKILLDQDTSVAQAYEILGMPTYVLIDKKGRIVSTGNTFPEGKYKELIRK